MDLAVTREAAPRVSARPRGKTDESTEIYGGSGGSGPPRPGSRMQNSIFQLGHSPSVLFTARNVPPCLLLPCFGVQCELRLARHAADDAFGNTCTHVGVHMHPRMCCRAGMRMWVAFRVREKG